MEALELLEIIRRGEDSRHQFKADVRNARSLAAEFVAFSNSGGGRLFVGVGNDGNIVGLTSKDMDRLNQLVSNAASQSIRPPINPRTENVSLPEGLVMVVTVSDGLSKPYMDNDGAIWVKSGADKRRVTAREEMLRMFQASGLVQADELPAHGLTVADLDAAYFEKYFEERFGEKVEEQGIPLAGLLENMNLMVGGVLNISGALLFAKDPSRRLPAFVVKAIAYPGDRVDETTYLDSQDIAGKLADMFDLSKSFLLRNLRHTQQGQGINVPGKPEIPSIVIEELLVNAFIHRDYFVTAPIRIFVFANRVEIISPGHLSNKLTVENIKRGNSIMRNPILASHASHLLPYRGLGNGIVRALQAHPRIDFEDDRDGNLFRVVIWRV